jgi:DNA invertase Pin-like site-specific DNA recombinase
MAKAVRTGAVRCAIYTRKSTEEGLEQAFNSLDAQREACSAYIASQRHEGWVELRGAYDDGGFSGGNMERPGLRHLLAEVEAGRVDVIVVYKVDRLTRALSDFAKIVEVLDARSASFVSVTQAFNTTTSMGRLTLNVLLSFAQFEREVTGERIRDKIAASKAKGVWMGGPVPLGYRVEGRKLVIDEAGAVIVRHIFERYAALGSGRELIEELRADCYRTRLHQQPGKAPRGGVPFSRGMLFAMLSNRIYRGEVVHKGTAYPGEHLALIEQPLWDAAQAKIEANRINRKRRGNASAPSLLSGLLYDGHGRKMSPSHAVKAGKRYRYYITHGSERTSDGPAAFRLPAHDIEDVVVRRIAAFLTSKRGILSLFALDAAALALALRRGETVAQQLDQPASRRDIVDGLVQQVRLGDAEVSIDLDRAVLHAMLGIDTPISDEPILLAAAAVRVRRGKDVKLVIGDDIGQQGDRQLVDLLAEARAARDAVLAQPTASIKEVATSIRQCRTRLARLVRLSWLAPEIVTAIVEGRQPPQLTPRRLLTSDLPQRWDQQMAMLGFA